MKQYKNMKQVDRDLKILKLEKDIAWEEIKGLKEDYKENFMPVHWVQTAISLGSRYGLMVLLKKIINR